MPHRNAREAGQHLLTACRVRPHLLFRTALVYQAAVYMHTMLQGPNNGDETSCAPEPPRPRLPGTASSQASDLLPKSILHLAPICLHRIIRRHRLARLTDGDPYLGVHGVHGMRGKGYG